MYTLPNSTAQLPNVYESFRKNMDRFKKYDANEEKSVQNRRQARVSTSIRHKLDQCLSVVVVDDKHHADQKG